MNRTEVVREVLSADPIPGSTPAVNDDATFLECYPGGFAPIGRAGEGDVLQFSPARIVAVGEGLTDAQFRRLCVAIWRYQQRTIVSVGMRHPADLIVMKFISDEPEDATVLAATARRLHLSLVRFLGADRGAGVKPEGDPGADPNDATNPR